MGLPHEPQPCMLSRDYIPDTVGQDKAICKSNIVSASAAELLCHGSSGPMQQDNKTDNTTSPPRYLMYRYRTRATGGGLGEGDQGALLWRILRSGTGKG